MDKSEKEELRSEIWDFMLAYQEEHAEEPIPPTLAEIEKRFDLSGRNVALAYVLELVEEGLVEVLDRGWRKYAAVYELVIDEIPDWRQMTSDELHTRAMELDLDMGEWRQRHGPPQGEDNATTKTPAT